MIMKTTEMLAEKMPLTQRKEELKKMAAAYEGKQAPQIELQEQRALYHLMPPAGWLNAPTSSFHPAA